MSTIKFLWRQNG